MHLTIFLQFDTHHPSLDHVQLTSSVYVPAEQLYRRTNSISEAVDSLRSHAYIYPRRGIKNRLGDPLCFEGLYGMGI